MSRPGFRRFLGVSLGGGRGKTTAIARLELDDGGVLTLAEARARSGHRGGGPVGDPEAAFRDGVLVQWLRRASAGDDTVVAIDAPLTLPPCLRCPLACPGVTHCEVPVVKWMRKHAEGLRVRGRSDPGKPAMTPYTQRATELVLERMTRQPREALGQGLGPLAARANYLRRVLSPRLRLHENLIEVHPRATLIRLFGAATERRTRQGDTEATWSARADLLARLTEGLAFDRVWPELVVRSVHVFHAVIAAFSALAWVEESSAGPGCIEAAGDPALAAAAGELGDLWIEDGWIWTPRSRRPGANSHAPPVAGSKDQH